MRIDLGEGRWAELHDRITHRMVVQMEAATYRAKFGMASGSFPEDFDTTVILTMTKEWSLGELTREVLEASDADLVDKLYDACDELYKKGRGEEVIPPASRPPSAKSPTDSAPPSSTRTSSTPTSS